MTDESDDLPLTCVPKPGQEIDVWFEVICDHFGGCEHCKGMSTTKELGIDTGSDKDLPVLCNHWCHHAAPKA